MVYKSCCFPLTFLGAFAKIPATRIHRRADRKRIADLHSRRFSPRFPVLPPISERFAARVRPAESKCHDRSLIRKRGKKESGHCRAPTERSRERGALSYSRCSRLINPEPAYRREQRPGMREKPIFYEKNVSMTRWKSTKVESLGVFQAAETLGPLETLGTGPFSVRSNGQPLCPPHPRLPVSLSPVLSDARPLPHPRSFSLSFSMHTYR